MRVQDAAGHSVSVERDAEGNVLRLLDASGNATRWTYDAVGRVTRKQYADGKTDEYVYAQGLLTQSRNPRGALTNYSYDDNDNVTLVNYASTPDVGLVYDALDRVTSMSDALGTTSYAYDVLSRTSSVNGPFINDTVSYTYDAVGRSSGMGVGNSDGTSFNTTYGYDALDRASTLSSPVGTWSAAYVGNTEMVASVLAPNGTRSQYSYDSLQRLTGVTNRTSSNAIVSQYGYTINNAKSIRTAMQEYRSTQPLRSVNYGYDAVDQLTSESQSEATLPSASTRNQSFAYDAMGNRTARTLSQSVNGGAANTTNVLSTHNSLNQLTAQSASVNGGAAISTALSYDASGNLTGQSTNNGGSTYTYDDADRLISLVQKDTATGAFTKKSEYAYDGQSRKVISREYSWDTASSAWTLAEEKRRVYDGMDVVQERDASNTTKVNYTRSGNIGGLLARSDASGNYFFDYDGSGNVVGLTNVSQQTVAEYSYDAWGNTLRATGAMAAVNAYRYSTKEYQSASGLYDYDYRFYSPGLGRWINRDPIRERGGLNLYGFVENDPSNYSDSHGLQIALPPGSDALPPPAKAVLFCGVVLWAAGTYVVNNPPHINLPHFNLPSLTGSPATPPPTTPVTGYPATSLPPGYPPFLYPAKPAGPIFDPFPSTPGLPSFDFAKDGRGGRGRFERGEDALDQLDGIENAQDAVRRGQSGQIIDSIEKSKQRLKNALRRIRTPEDAEREFGDE